jgi:hypothetical protein
VGATDCRPDRRDLGEALFCHCSHPNLTGEKNRPVRELKSQE